MFADSEDSAKISLKRRSLAGRKKLCPNCLNELTVATEVSGWLVPTFYYCSSCGYSGYVALEKAPKEG
jgi:predicted RNA-binding Zn-ribbon protein involved in translation (DUF1610 family)